MNGQHHDAFKRMIDESLAGALSAEDEKFLREHLATCAPCGAYLNASCRVIESLGGFRFEMNPTLDARVLAALKQETESLARTVTNDSRTMQPRNLQSTVWAAFAAALLLSVAGSVLVYRVAKLLMVPMTFDTAQVQAGVLVFWLLPSICAALGVLAAPHRDRGIA